MKKTLSLVEARQKAVNDRIVGEMGLAEGLAEVVGRLEEKLGRFGN